jgi:hypothetical protein
VREGQGFVAAHVGLTAFESWPEFLDLLGCALRRPSDHAARARSSTNGRTFRRRSTFPPSFAFNDEFYQPKEHSRDKIDVLLRLDLSNVPASDSLHLKGDYPLAWAKMYGKGRVFYRVVRALVGDLGHAQHSADVLRGDAMGARLSDAELKPHAMTPAPPATRRPGGRPALKSRLACCSSTRFASMPGIAATSCHVLNGPCSVRLARCVGGVSGDVERFGDDLGRRSLILTFRAERHAQVDRQRLEVLIVDLCTLANHLIDDHGPLETGLTPVRYVGACMTVQADRTATSRPGSLESQLPLFPSMKAAAARSARTVQRQPARVTQATAIGPQQTSGGNHSIGPRAPALLTVWLRYPSPR